MQSNQKNNAIQIGIIFLRCAAFLMGGAIFFGDMFFWSSGSVLVHLYSTLSLTALSLGAVYATSRQQRFIVLWVVSFHILATIFAALQSGQIYFALMVVLLDLALISISRGSIKHTDPDQ